MNVLHEFISQFPECGSLEQELDEQKIPYKKYGEGYLLTDRSFYLDEDTKDFFNTQLIRELRETQNRKMSDMEAAIKDLEKPEKIIPLFLELAASMLDLDGVRDIPSLVAEIDGLVGVHIKFYGELLENSAVLRHVRGYFIKNKDTGISFYLTEEHIRPYLLRYCQNYFPEISKPYVKKRFAERGVYVVEDK